MRGEAMRRRSVAVSQCRSAATCSARVIVEAVARLAAGLSRGIGAVVIVSGRIDVAADGERAYGISNGDAMMGRLTGTGCMGSGVVASFLGAAPGEPLASSIAGMCVMGLAGELARKKLAPSSGTGNKLVPTRKTCTSAWTLFLDFTRLLVRSSESDERSLCRRPSQV